MKKKVKRDGLDKFRGGDCCGDSVDSQYSLILGKKPVDRRMEKKLRRKMKCLPPF